MKSNYSNIIRYHESEKKDVCFRRNQPYKLLTVKNNSASFDFTVLAIVPSVDAKDQGSDQEDVSKLLACPLIMLGQSQSFLRKDCWQL